MTWIELGIEKLLKKVLKKNKNIVKADLLLAGYISTRENLIENVLGEIKGKLPSMSDHGPSHVANVLNNIEKLLGDEINQLSCLELYSLCLATLFHDVGNLYGREEHQTNIADIYDFATKGKNKQEKYIVLKTCQAHCGYSIDGSKDTLKDVDQQYPLYGMPIRLRDIAAILRLSDELAEGPQRTSEYMQKAHLYESENEIFHKYASVTDICIDRGNERILLTYNIELKTNDKGLLDPEKEKEFKDLIKFIYKRIIKLDQERKYAKFFCNLLSPLKTTSIQFNIWFRGNFLNLCLNPINLSDIVIPGDDSKKISEIDSNYEIEALFQRVKSEMQKAQELKKKF